MFQFGLLAQQTRNLAHCCARGHDVIHQQGRLLRQRGRLSEAECPPDITAPIFPVQTKLGRRISVPGETSEEGDLQTPGEGLPQQQSVVEASFPTSLSVGRHRYDPIPLQPRCAAPIADFQQSPQRPGQPAIATELESMDDSAQITFIVSPGSGKIKRRGLGSTSSAGGKQFQKIAWNRYSAAVADPATQRLERLEASLAERTAIRIESPPGAKNARLRENEGLGNLLDEANRLHKANNVTGSPVREVFWPGFQEV